MGNQTSSVYSNVRVERRAVFSQIEGNYPFCVRATHSTLGPIELPFLSRKDAQDKADELLRSEAARAGARIAYGSHRGW
jgi:hypothetical protein